ncbi:MAG: PAS domain S-box protein [Betaproteobacteria bacterium]|nr:PAS domain S-box protein [Betaproteobacteria bacterium]
MMDELSRLLAINGFLPHGYCISWSQPLVLTFVISDILIFLSYFSMPVALVNFARQRKDFPYHWVLWLFAAFIMACGTTHLMGAIVLWQPMYNLDAMLKAFTAIISVITAILLWPLIPHALKLPSPAQLKQANAELQHEIVARRRFEDELRVAKEAAEDSLQKERILMSAIVEFSDDAIIGKTLQGIVTAWNRGAEKIFGYSAAEMVGHPILELIPPGRRAEEEMILAAIRRGESVLHFETERVRKDGRLIDISVTVSPIRDKSGQIIGASKIARDITEARQTQAKIQELNNTLEQRVVERTAELKAANEELDAFAYAVTHDLRAPLRAMTAFSKILLEDFGDKLEPEAKKSLDHIIAASGNMGQLIEGLLVLSRVTRGEIKREQIDVSAMAQRIREELERTDPHRKVSWEIEPGLSLRGDPRMLESVMRNLLGNAWKYTHHVAAPLVRVRAVLENGKPQICVEDNGAGFDMAYAEQLFQPFRRLHRQEEFPGLGIGLATVLRIVRRHGGSIRAAAAPGQGAAFFFSFPEHEAKEAA